MRKQQHGMTTIGMIILVGFIGIFVYGGLLLAPMYLESMRIQQVLNTTKENLDGQKATIAEIRRSLSAGLTTNSLYDMNAREDFEVARTGEGYKVTADYEREKAFIANVFMVAKFNHSVEINR